LRHLGHLLRPFAACAALVALSLLSAAACAATRVDLNRDWQFRADPRGAGEADGWITSIPSATQSVTVPHTWNIGTLHDYLGVAWYFRSFELLPQSPGTHLELHFGATFYSARVWLNGVELGTHEGGFTAYSFDITTRVRARNLLVVRLDNRPGAATIPGFAERGEPKARYDWWTYGGIVRDVWLSTSGPAWVRRQSIRTEQSTPGAVIHDRIFLLSDFSKPTPVELSVTAYGSDNQAAARDTRSVTLAAGAADVTVSLALPAPRLWDIDHPNLYRMVVQLTRHGGEPLDEQTDTFGVRTFEIRDRHLLVNGERARLTGIARHEDSPWEGLAETQGTMQRDYDDMLDLHTTLTRPVHYPQNPFILDYADRHGIALIPEIPVWQFTEAQLSDPQVLALARQQMRELVEEAGNHPSIFAWSVANESATGTPGGIAYFRAMRDFIRQLDPGRFVSFADDSFPKLERAEQSAANDADFLMMNQYFGTWHGPAGALGPALDHVNHLFPDKMVIVSEFGYPGFYAKDPLRADPNRIQTLREQMPILAARDWIAGAIQWCFQDYKSPRNLWPGQSEGYVEHGVVDENRQRKPSYEAWKQLSAVVQLDVHWVGPTEAIPTKFTARLIPNSQQDLPYRLLKDYLLDWNLQDEKGISLARGQHHFEQLAGATSVDGSLPTDLGRNFRKLTVTLHTPGGVVAAERTLEWTPKTSVVAGTRRASFNDEWRFRRGDVAGAENPNFDDQRWTSLRLPHDWAIEGPFDRTLNPHTGALPISGIGWYRKMFTLPTKGYYAIEFDGAMANSRVWLNGHELGGRPYGYSGFGFDLTPFLHAPGSPNVIAVRLAPEANSSRWYPGAGIYRNVWLDNTGPVSVARWGTYVTTPEVSANSATVVVKTELRNRLASDSPVTVRSSVIDSGGEQVARVDTQVTIAAGGNPTIPIQLTVQRPQLWDLEHPHLYSLVTELMSDDKVVDRYITPFGIRTIAFDAQKGFSLNGQILKLHGVCLHHDLGALGAAVNRRAIERQLEIMKAAGVNAIRTSHNPPAPELLEYADRMGFLVMDEAFDMWRIPKVPNGYSKYFDEWSERDLRDMVRRDRNHPSIILWSIGNEIPEQKSPDGWREARRLTTLFHQEDPTRPTTSAFNNWDDAIRNKLADEVDIPGFNYKPNFYQRIHDEHPKWIIYGSETASCVSSRGTYHLPLQSYGKDPSLQISSYDIIAPRWAYCPDVEFAAQEALPAVLGEFVWTGFDYLGEPTPYFGENEDDSHDWPARSSYFGMVDLAGFPKDRYYLYQSVWSHEPMVHVLPHWNWEGHEGQDIPVMVYSNADEVELSLNGRSLGRKKTFDATVELPVGPNVSASGKFQSKYRLAWTVPFQRGTLTATGYRHGEVVARDEVHTAGPPARISLVADRSVIAADGDDLSFITVRIEDRDGHLCPLAANEVNFKVSGAGRIAAVDNGNAATVEPFHADHRKAFNGLALLIVRSAARAAGQIQIEATGGAGLAPAQLVIESR